MLLGEIVKLVNQGFTGVKLQLFQLLMVRTREAIGIGFTLFTVHCTLVYCVFSVFSVYVLLSPLWCGLFSVQRAPVQVHQAMSCQPTHEGDFKRCQVKPQVACLMEKPTVPSLYSQWALTVKSSVSEGVGVGGPLTILKQLKQIRNPFDN